MRPADIIGYPNAIPYYETERPDILWRSPIDIVGIGAIPKTTLGPRGSAIVGSIPKTTLGPRGAALAASAWCFPQCEWVCIGQRCFPQCEWVCPGGGGGHTVAGAMSPPSRPSCIECTEKHLGAAYVMTAEMRDGYDYRLRIIGHLHEAEDESQAWPVLHNAIREARKHFQLSGKPPNFPVLAALAARVRGHGQAATGFLRGR